MTKPAVQPQERICLEHADELAYWTKTLQVDAASLKQAVSEVGSNPGRVRLYLHMRKKRSGKSVFAKLEAAFVQLRKHLN